MGLIKMEVMRCKYKGQVLFDHYFGLDKPLYDTTSIQRQTISTGMQKNKRSIVSSMLMAIPGMVKIIFLGSEENGARFTGTWTSCADFTRGGDGYRAAVTPTLNLQ